MSLTIHPDLRSLVPPLTPEERAQLEANLRTDGCLDPLIVWQETDTVLDGHNRLAICEEHDVPYATHRISLPDLDAAKAWIITHQLGRRNLTPDQMSYYRGEHYNLQKHRHGGDRKSDASSTQNGNLKTVDRLAREHGVSRNTIDRDGAYAEAVETLVAVFGPAIRQTILAGQYQLARSDVRLLATLTTTSPETAQAVREALLEADPAPTLRALLLAARCGICHRPLTDPASVSRGIGPVCAGHGANGHRTGGSGGGAHVAASPLSTPEPAAAPLTLEDHLAAAYASVVALHTALVACPLPEALDPYVGVGRGLARVMFDVSELLRQHHFIFSRPTTAAPPQEQAPQPTAEKTRPQVRGKKRRA